MRNRTNAWKVFKYGVFYGPYFPVLVLNTGKNGPEKIPYLDTFHELDVLMWSLKKDVLILISLTSS